MNGLNNLLMLPSVTPSSDSGFVSTEVKEPAPSNDGGVSFKETLSEEISSQKETQSPKEKTSPQEKETKVEKEKGEEKSKQIEKKNSNSEKVNKIEAKEKKILKKEAFVSKDFSITDIISILNQFQISLQHNDNKSNKNIKELGKKLEFVISHLQVSLKKNDKLSVNDDTLQIKNILAMLEKTKDSKDISKTLKENLTQLVEILQKEISPLEKKPHLEKSSLKEARLKDDSAPMISHTETTEAVSKKTTEVVSKDNGLNTVKKEDASSDKEHSTKNETLNLADNTKSLNFQKELLSQMDKHASNIDHRAIVAKLAHQVVKTHVLGENKMVMKLFPEHLGKITVHLDKTGTDLMNVKMIVESSVVKDMVDSRLSQLKQQLSEAGLTLMEVSVNLGQSGSNGDSSKENTSGLRDFTSKGPETHSVNNANSNVIDIRRNPNGLLNIVA